MQGPGAPAAAAAVALSNAAEAIAGTRLSLARGCTIPWAVLQQVFVSPHGSPDQGADLAGKQLSKSKKGPEVCDGVTRGSRKNGNYYSWLLTSY